MNADKLGALAMGAIMRALATTVKPGLVDRRSIGARRELDFFMALEGFGAVAPFLLEIARECIDSASVSPTLMFSNIRKIGFKAEETMLRATKGVNVNKGGFFAVGICVGAAGRIVASKLRPDSNKVCALAAEMTQDVCRRELDTLDVKINIIGENSLTPGERAYMKHSIPGVRGEVQNGFQTVRRHALPTIRKLSSDKLITQNDIYVQTFMTLMAKTPDTGICDKENMAAMEEIQDRASGILERGGVLTPLGREKIEKLDAHLYSRGLHPGAAGTLLPVAIFLSMLDEEANDKGETLGTMHSFDDKGRRRGR